MVVASYCTLDKIFFLITCLSHRDFYVEVNLRNEKWLVNCSHNPNKTMICNHLDALSTYLDLHSTTYEKVFILGDFNVGIEEQYMKTFCHNYNLTSRIKQSTCYKNPNNPVWIDFILSNTPRSFQSACVRDRAIRFSFNDINCNEKELPTPTYQLQVLQKLLKWSL